MTQRFRKCAFEKALNGSWGWVISIVWLCIVVASFIGCSPEEQVEQDQGVTVGIEHGRIDIQAPGFSGKYERCPGDYK